MQTLDGVGRRPLGRLGALVVLAAAFVVLARGATVTPPHGDESQYIFIARYFQLLRDPGNVAWDDGRWAHDSPMLLRYVLGAWLTAAGYPPERIPAQFETYDFTRTVEENRGVHRVPDDRLLLIARAPMVLFGALAMLALYAAGCLLHGTLAGLAAAGLALSQPLVRTQLAMVQTEALWLTLALGAVVLLVWFGRDGRPLGGGQAVALGVVLGLACATKLTALLLLAAVGLWGGLVAAATAGARLAAHRRLGEALRAGALAALSWALVPAVAAAVFVASNPHLYRGPVEHTRHLFEFRATGTAGQQALFPEAAVYHLAERARFVVLGSFVSGAAGRGRESEPRVWLGGAALLALAAVGALALGRRALAQWRATRRLAPHAFVLLAVLVYFGGVTAGLGLAWTRYLLPTMLLGSLLSGIGCGVLARLLWRWCPGWRAALPPPDALVRHEGSLR